MFDLADLNGAGFSRHTLSISAGSARPTPGGAQRGRTADVTLTMGQFSLGYAGGYRSPAAAAMRGGLRGEDSALARLLAATADREPWLADYF
ncbi:sterol carrier protein domain-containing protein [Streptomyces sp. NPDC096191]|uniref:sterol carrier protein domain-containing protein n=1 Tax=Streptomyces sp. NPDC096191 TaxID=3155426 RepID=UPI0033231680